LQLRPSEPPKEALAQGGGLVQSGPSARCLAIAGRHRCHRDPEELLAEARPSSPSWSSRASCRRRRSACPPSVVLPLKQVGRYNQ
jgi:hypothetical protein